jgi:hypothetical protein
MAYMSFCTCDKSYIAGNVHFTAFPALNNRTYLIGITARRVFSFTAYIITGD